MTVSKKKAKVQVAVRKKLSLELLDVLKQQFKREVTWLFEVLGDVKSPA